MVDNRGNTIFFSLKIIDSHTYITMDQADRTVQEDVTEMPDHESPRLEFLDNKAARNMARRAKEMKESLSSRSNSERFGIDNKLPESENRDLRDAAMLKRRKSPKIQEFHCQKDASKIPIDLDEYFETLEAYFLNNCIGGYEWVYIWRLHASSDEEPRILQYLEDCQDYVEDETLDEGGERKFQKIKDQYYSNYREYYYSHIYLHRMCTLDTSFPVKLLATYIRKLSKRYTLAQNREFKSSKSGGFEPIPEILLARLLIHQLRIKPSVQMGMHRRLEELLKEGTTAVFATIERIGSQLENMEDILPPSLPAPFARNTTPNQVSLHHLPLQRKNDKRKLDSMNKRPQTEGTRRFPGPCPHCGKPHDLRDCDKWKRRHDNEWERMKLECPRCLVTSHTFRQCNRKIGKEWPQELKEEFFERINKKPRRDQEAPKGSSNKLHAELNALKASIATLSSKLKLETTSVSNLNASTDLSKNAETDKKDCDNDNRWEINVVSPGQTTNPVTITAHSININWATDPPLLIEWTEPPIVIDVYINGVYQKALIDTGSALSFIDGDFLNTIPMYFPVRRAQYKNITVTQANGSPLPIQAALSAWLQLQNDQDYTSIEIILGVVKNLQAKLIFGLDILRKLHDMFPNISNTLLEISSPNRTNSFFSNYRFQISLHDPGDYNTNVSIHKRKAQDLDVESNNLLLNINRNNHYSTLWKSQYDKPLLLNMANFAVLSDKPKSCIKLSVCKHKIAQVHNTNSTKANDSLESTCLNEQVQNATALQEGEKLKLLKLCMAFKKIWNASGDNLSCTNASECVIQIQPGKRPIKDHLRPESPQKQAEIQEVVNELLAKGLIQKSTSPWGSSVVIVRHPNKANRFCIDYRKLNGIMEVPVYPLPRILDIIFHMSGKNYFSSLDLTKGYWQIPIQKESIQYTAFQTTDGHFEWLRMPFGLANAPAEFQRLMDNILAGLKPSIAIAYLDDIIVFSDTFEHHLLALEKVFKRIQECSLQLSPKKCDFCKLEMSYLGFIVCKNGHKPDPNKIKAVLNLKIPQTLKETRSFLGMASYYRRFIRDFAQIAAPLHELTRKDISYEWTENTQFSFEHIKRLITEASLLYSPKSGDIFVVDCDASTIGLGAVLSSLDPQDRKKPERPIAFQSRLLQENERKWSITELEAFAVIWALEQFRPWIEGHETLVRTDHSPLVWLQKNVAKTNRLARWVMALREYNFTLLHKPGKAHVVPDYLSRDPIQKRPEDKLDLTYEPFSLDDTLAKAMGTFPTITCTATNTLAAIRINNIENLPREDSSTTNLSQHMDNNIPVNEQKEWPEVIGSDIAILNNPTKDNIVPSPIDKSAIEHYQSLCPDCISVKQWIISNKQDLRPRWLLKYNLIAYTQNGIIMVHKHSLTNPSEKKKQILLPQALRDKVIQYFHKGPAAGHFGRTKTLSRIRLYYNWPTIDTDVRRKIAACGKCWSQTPQGRRLVIPQSKLPIGWPNEIVAMDLFGPLSLTNTGNRYVMVVIDHFTKWVVVEPLKSATAEETARVLQDRWFSIRGIPQYILSDNGPNFNSQILTNLGKICHFNNLFSTPYHPQSNGIVEAFMKPLKNAIAACIKEDPSWDQYLASIAFAHNTTPSISTGYTPFFLNFGYEAALPLQKELGNLSLGRVSAKWLSNLWIARNIIYTKHIAEVKRRKACVRKIGHCMPIGAIVAAKANANDLLQESGSSKFKPKWIGLFVIQNIGKSGKTFQIKHLVNGTLRTVNRDQLKLLSLPKSATQFLQDSEIEQEKGNLIDSAEISDLIVNFNPNEELLEETLGTEMEDKAIEPNLTDSPPNVDNNKGHPVTQNTECSQGENSTDYSLHEVVIQRSAGRNLRKTPYRLSSWFEEAGSQNHS